MRSLLTYYVIVTLTFDLSDLLAPPRTCAIIAVTMTVCGRRGRVHDGKARMSRGTAVSQSDWWIRVRGDVSSWIHSARRRLLCRSVRDPSHSLLARTRTNLYIRVLDLSHSLLPTTNLYIHLL